MGKINRTIVGSKMISEILLLALISSVGAEMESFIVGGKETTISHWPFITFIHVTMGDEVASACGGSLLSSQTVLTAAHCVDDVTDSKKKFSDFQFYIFMGHTAYTKSTMVRRMLDYTSHRQYDPQDSDVRHDIAIMFLKGPVAFGPNIKKVLLYNHEMGSGDTKVEVAGWGATELDDVVGSMPTRLKAARLNAIDLRQCQNLVRSAVDKVICTRPSRDFAYSGDSGGPLMKQNSPYQVGIVSYRDEDVKYTVFTSVPDYYNWIKNTQYDLYRKYCPNRFRG